MHRDNLRTYFSATDLADFIVCRHITALGLLNLDTPLPRKQDDEETRILQDHGIEHETAYLEKLKAEGRRVIEIPADIPPADRYQLTDEALRAGPDVIFQAALESGPFRGYADFLLKVSTPSKLGPFSYEVADTKLARHGKARHLIQIALYSDMVAEAQGVAPAYAHLELGDNSTKTYRLDDYRHYIGAVKQRFLEFVAGCPPTVPEKCGHCGLCAWEDLCNAKWLEADHLNQVANIRADEIRKLRAVGIDTLEALASTMQAVPAVAAFETLQTQAALQLRKRKTGKDEVYLKRPDAAAGNGFYRLPKPDDGDLYFDMEGYPYERNGLEYLFGVSYRENGEFRFKPFWGHDRAGEKQAFEQLVDFVIERIERFPGLHVYHYADYEKRALQKLMQLHGTREKEVDRILREHRLVDLYAVVRNALMTSEPRYSIKNLETFYMKGERQSDVKNAGASIVYYEHWRKDKNQQWLDDIERYNEEDCVSTWKLHDWLLRQREEVQQEYGVALPWYREVVAEDEPGSREEKERSPEALAAEALKLEVTASVIKEIDAAAEPHRREAAELMLHLLDFYWRERKPSFWKMFAQQEKTLEELIGDLDAIGGLVQDEAAGPTKDKQSLIYTYGMPQQEHRLKVGDAVRETKTLLSIGAIVAIDPDARTVKLRIGKQTLDKKWKGRMPAALSIAASNSVNTGVLQGAILRLAASRYANQPTGDYAAIWNLLERRPPAVEGVVPGTALLNGEANVADVSGVVQRLRESHLVIQGPPGTGKTHTGARAILDLLQQGKRVGVCATSHKAVANLLDAVTTAAIEAGVTFSGARRGDEDAPLRDSRFIKDVAKPEEALDLAYRLVGGTAWTFAREEADQSYDYLFIDEAGQVSLANLAAIGCCAKNIVLLGDQMQLGQPLPGTHPGNSGLSALEYLLREHATVPPELGILLNVSRRMHPAICRFISDAVYEGRLTHYPDTENQRLVLQVGADPALRETGIVFEPILHEGCAQASPHEAERIKMLIESLREQSFVVSSGTMQPIKAENILVVAPYNAQVRLLKEVLPGDIAIGTVDKFQGQEAEVVIVSMATSGAEDMPRNMEFLFDRNRLNVAISRARTLAVIVASPGLLEINCSTPDQMALVNTLCWAASLGTSCLPRHIS